jgi:hypothetical protein
MSLAARKNIGTLLMAAYASAVYSMVAADGTNDNVEATGGVLDRSAFGMPLSCSVIYSILASVATAKTFSLAYKVQSGSKSDGSDMADYAAVASAVILNAGAAQTTIVKQDVDLSGAGRYIRIKFTPDLSATSVDTAVVAPFIVFGGMAELPQPAASTNQ